MSDPIIFPNLQIKQTFLKNNQQPRGEFIKFKQLVPKKLVRNIFISGYSIDMVWLLGKVNRKCGLVVVESPHKNESVGEFKLSKNRYTIRPDHILDHSTIHAKLLLIEFDHSIRVVFGSPNLIPEDWNVTQNIVIFQDFPKLPTPSSSFEKYPLTQDLDTFFGSLRISQKNYDFLKKYNFASFKAELVLSIPNKKLKHQSGVHSLKNKVQKLLKPNENGENSTYAASYLSSSIGSINQSYIINFMDTIFGEKKEQHAFKIFYPSNIQQDMIDLIKQHDTTGAYFCHNIDIEEIGKYFYRFKNYNPKHFSHMKMILFFESTDLINPKFVYIGSHNLSLSAWGITNKEGSICTHYEIGVLLRYDDCKFFIPFDFSSITPYNSNERPIKYKELRSNRPRAQKRPHYLQPKSNRHSTPKRPPPQNRYKRGRH